MGSRSTQFIGLNMAALNFIHDNDLCPISSNNHTFGMFGEQIPLGVWRDKDGKIWTEFVQDAPWSSGPMIFTALKSGEEVVCEWELDENLGAEFDQESGKYWV